MWKMNVRHLFIALKIPIIKISAKSISERCSKTCETSRGIASQRDNLADIEIHQPYRSVSLSHEPQVYCVCRITSSAAQWLLIHDMGTHRMGEIRAAECLSDQLAAGWGNLWCVAVESKLVANRNFASLQQFAMLIRSDFKKGREMERNICVYINLQRLTYGTRPDS